MGANQTAVRFKYIDSLRGIAALYVVAGHALNEYYFKLSSNVGLPFEWLKQLTSGLVGVFLFFAISGFVIPASFSGGIPPLWAFETVVLILSCLFAAIGYYFVERPAIALGKQLGEKPAPVTTS